jgi:hypothetical protein
LQVSCFVLFLLLPSLSFVNPNVSKSSSKFYSLCFIFFFFYSPDLDFFFGEQYVTRELQLLFTHVSLLLAVFVCLLLHVFLLAFLPL